MPGANQSSHCVVETEKKTEADMANALPKFNSDGSKCTSKGPGLNKAFVNKKAQFTVDSSSAGRFYFCFIFRNQIIIKLKKYRVFRSCPLLTGDIKEGNF